MKRFHNTHWQHKKLLGHIRHHQESLGLDNSRDSNLIDSVSSLVGAELRIPNLGVIFGQRFRFWICASLDDLEQVLLVGDVADVARVDDADGEGANQNQTEEKNLTLKC